MDVMFEPKLNLEEISRTRWTHAAFKSNSNAYAMPN